MYCSDFSRCFSREEFDKAESYGRLYVFNKPQSYKDACNIQKVQLGGKYDGKEIAPLPYSGVANGNDNSVGDEKPNESK